ncbi:MAG: heparinase II/III family protein, partial [Kiritimatiellaeota bacterium]|nr:heparinase II/III family protein [Kiritimatiellota bacterium]
MKKVIAGALLAAALVSANADETVILFNVAQMTLGATAKGTSTGGPFNKDWPASQTLLPPGRGGALWGTQETLIGGRVDIRPIMAVDIEAIAVQQLNWGDVRVPKTVAIYINGEKKMTQEIPLQPGVFFEFPCVAKNVSEIGIEAIDEHPRKVKADGSLGPGYGGWSRIKVMSKTDLSGMLAAPKDYAPAKEPNAVAASQKAIAGEVKVYGEPRQTVGHPNTIWDQQDIDELKAMMATSPTLKKQYEALKGGMDLRITQPVGVPPAIKNDKGEYIHVSDGVTIPGESSARGNIHTQCATDIANLGAVYALSGEEKYAEFAKQMLLAYATEFPNYAPGNRPGFTHDVGKISDQRLSDSIWVIHVARGYDLIYNLPSITAEEREHIQNNLLILCADFIKDNRAHLISPTNWSAISTAAILIIGYATDNERLINMGRWGNGGTPEKPTGGVHLHFSEKSIDIDGMWSEGAMGYQFMALQGLITDAEILWHHGENMYAYRNGALKSLFDSPLEFSYPDLFTPAIHDSGNASIVGYDSYLYEHAYRRYRDPKYLVILNKIAPHLAARYQQWPVSIIYDLDPNEKAAAVEWDSVNLNGVGYAILRNTDERGTRSLLIDYGPDRSHGHPDKLNIDLWLYGDLLVPDPGMVWYENPIYANWYHQTLSHNTLTVDEKSQLYSDAELLVYAPALTFGMMRAATSEAYPGVTMDRALFLTPEYTADIFGAFAQLPRKYDLAWHIRGDFTSPLKFADFAFEDPVPAAYAELANVKSADGSKPWSAEYLYKDKKYRFLTTGEKGEKVIVGDGVLGNERPKTLLLRREAGQTVYGAVLDHSLADKPFVKSVKIEGSLKAGNARMKIETATGTDTAFVAYRPDSAKDFDSTAFVRKDNKKGITAAALGGGTALKFDDLQITREAPGLFTLELVENGSYIIANPSASNTTVKLAFKPLNGLEAYKIAPDGKRMGDAQLFRQDRSANGAMIIPMEAGERFEFAKKGTLSLSEYRAKLLADRAAADAAAAQKVVDEINAREAARQAAAAENPVPANTIVVVQAEDFTAEGGGKVNILKDRIATIGSCLQGW